MKSFTTIAAVGALAASVSATPAQGPQKRATITPITIKGSAFFQGDKRFYIRGVDYQPGGSSAAEDPIADVAGCKRDVAKFKELGLNTIRVYTVDNSANHDECMTELANAGIYLALDVNSPNYSINREKPARSYNKMYLQSVFATIDAFAKYDNTLLFFSGNEVINDDKTTQCAPYIKAVDRDMRSYINARKYRKIPVGYSAADVEENRVQMAQYMNCGPDGARSDFYAFNDYAWCDPDTSSTDWEKKAETFSNYSIPLFLSEYGCNENKREFNAVKGLYGDKMTKAYSGGLVYEYTEEGSKYGLVKLDGDNVKTLDDFDALKKAFKNTPIPTTDGNYNQQGSPSKCPTKGDHWNVDMKDDVLPSMPQGVDEFFKNGAGAGKGLKGGSQEAGSDKTVTGPAASGAITTGATNSGSAGAASSPSASAGAASSLRSSDFSATPFVTGFVVLVSSVLGAALL
ncbi:glycoside hydrolase family 72 protein [Periconia macrospinosa]|uniref:1,3-beta-glucanosyltransferase n=1 Tax=Periconia macrospinosa TaxID=97972 RepID=A0A2V1DFT4_9PLEO|nr:glycoside hydrolase family 72 protein [Periconia macrospinosa]